MFITINFNIDAKLPSFFQDQVNILSQDKLIVMGVMPGIIDLLNKLTTAIRNPQLAFSVLFIF